MLLIQLLVAGILFLSRVHGVRSSVHPELAASLSQSALTPATSVEDRHSKHEADGGGSNLESASCSVATWTERNNECERKRSCFPSFICDVFSFNPP